MADEPLFPRGQGAAAGTVIPAAVPVDDGGKPIHEPPGADGFGVETLFTIDNTTPGEVIVEKPVFEAPDINTDLVLGAVAIQFYPGATLGTPVPFTDLDTRLARIAAPRSGSVRGVFVHTFQLPTGVSRLDLGLYDDDANLLAHTGRIAFSAIPDPVTNSNWQRYTFITPKSVSAGDLLKIGFYADIDTGSWLFTPVILPEPVRSLYLNGITTVEQFAKKELQVRLAAGVPPTELVDDPYLVYGVASHADTPWAMLDYL